MQDLEWKWKWSAQQRVDKAVAAHDRLLQIKLENQNKLEKELDHKILASAKL